MSAGMSHCPRCESHGCVTVRCEPGAPMQGCPGGVGSHTHTICARCGFHWISAGEIPRAMRTMRQLEISISHTFDHIVGLRARKTGGR